MIMIVRTATIKPGKMPAAIEGAKKLAAHIKENHGPDFQVLIPIGGNPLRIKWRTEVEDFSTIEALQTALMQDKTHFALTEEFGECLIEIHDTFWRTV